MRNEDRFRISSSQLEIGMTSRGGQLFSVKSRAGHEFLWQPDPAVWNDSAPFLFPYVGKSRGGRVRFHGREFPMPVHGFSGGLPWECTALCGDRAEFCLCSSADTRSHYPFDFQLQTSYHAKKNTLTITRMIRNTGEEPMPFTMGEHLGLRTNLRQGALFDQHRLRFEKQEAPVRICTTQGLFLKQAVPMEWTRSKTLALHKEFFGQVPVLILKEPRSSWVELEAGRNSRRVRAEFGQVPYLIFWSPPQKGEFVCVEPCWGSSSWVGETMDGFRRRGVILLAPGETFRYLVKLTFDEPEPDAPQGKKDQ